MAERASLLRFSRSTQELMFMFLEKRKMAARLPRRTHQVAGLVALVIAVSALSFIIGRYLDSVPSDRSKAVGQITGAADNSPPSKARASALDNLETEAALTLRNREHADARIDAAQREEADFARFEQAFRADGIDTAWAIPAELALREAVIDPALAANSDPKTFSARCMSRMCQVNMEFSSLPHAQDWAELYVIGMADAVSLVRSRVIPLEDGGAQLILFGVRQGSEDLLQPTDAPLGDASSGP